MLCMITTIRVSEVCPEGYLKDEGDIWGWGSDLGSKLSVSSIEECASKCDALPLCLSFEHSSTEQLCNLNKIARPSHPKAGDYLFCRKLGESNYLFSYFVVKKCWFATSKGRTWIFFGSWYQLCSWKFVMWDVISWSIGPTKDFYRSTNFCIIDLILSIG